MLEFVLAMIMSTMTSVFGVVAVPPVAQPPVPPTTCTSPAVVQNGACVQSDFTVTEKVCQTNPKTGITDCWSKVVKPPTSGSTKSALTAPTKPTLGAVTIDSEGNSCVAIQANGMKLDYCAPKGALTNDQLLANAMRSVTLQVNQGFWTGCSAVSITKTEQSLGVKVAC